MSFISSIFLWFLPLASLPLIFHLLKKKQYINIKFSTLRFFRTIEHESINKLNIINILLLIIRTLIIISIILILSRPTINTSYNTQNFDSSKIVVIYVDNSYSNSNSIINKTNKLLETIKEIYHNNTQILIYSISDNKLLYSNNLEKVSSIDIAYHPVSFNNIDIDKIDYSDTIYISRDMYILSDLQNSLFNNLSKNITDFLYSWNIFVVKTKTINNNIFIEKIDIDTLIEPNEIFEISSTVNNINYEKNDIEIELYIDNINVGKNIINSKPNIENKLRFKTTIPKNKEYDSYIRIIGSDNNQIDNKFFFTINSNINKSISIISNDNSDYFLSKAINAKKMFDNTLDIQKFNTTEYLTNSSDFFDTVILFGYENFNDHFYNKAISQTNNLILFPSEKVLDNKYLNQLIGQNQYENLKAIYLDKGNYITLDNDLTNSDNFRNIFFSEKNNRSIEFYSYLNIPISSNTLVSYSNGYSFLNQYKHENLNIFMVHSRLELAETNFPLKGTFIPFINLLTESDTKKNFYYSGQIFKNSNKLSMTHVTPFKDSILTNNDNILLNQPGFHTLKTNVSTTSMPININTLEFKEPIMTREYILSTLPNAIIIDNYDNISSEINNLVTGYELWRYFLYFLILLTILEMFLSNYYYYRKDG